MTPRDLSVECRRMIRSCSKATTRQGAGDTCQVGQVRPIADLSGVVAFGSSHEQVADRIREALDAYARELAKLGRLLPEPVATAETIHAHDQLAVAQRRTFRARGQERRLTRIAADSRGFPLDSGTLGD
jgi:predicted RNase H-like HicB family nuclease